MSDAMRLVGWPCVYLLGVLVVVCQSDIRRAIGQYLDVWFGLTKGVMPNDAARNRMRLR